MTTMIPNAEVELHPWIDEEAGNPDARRTRMLDVDIPNIGGDLTVATIAFHVTDPDVDDRGDEFPIHRVALTIEDADHLHSITIQGIEYVVDQEVGVLTRDGLSVRRDSSGTVRVSQLGTPGYVTPVVLMRDGETFENDDVEVIDITTLTYWNDEWTSEEAQAVAERLRSAGYDSAADDIEDVWLP